MSLVHAFATVSELLPGFRIPFQYIGDGETPAARAIPDEILLAWIVANLPAVSSRLNVQTATGVAAAGTLAVSAEMMLSKVIVIGSTTGTFSLGTTVSGTELIEAESFDTDGAVYVLDRYFHSGATLHFSGFAGTITVKLVLISLTA